MPSLKEVISKVHEYAANYRESSLPDFEFSEIYDLFPENGVKSPASMAWPDTYPFADRAGVYLVMSETLQVSYIGKASFGSSIGARLSAYFVYEQGGKGCFVKNRENWILDPRYIVTVAVPKDQSFEAPALEEFLILAYGSELPDNKVGTS